MSDTTRDVIGPSTNGDTAASHANDIGRALAARNQLTAAVHAFRRAIGLAPQLAEPHNNMGSALHRMGSLEAAAASFRRAIALRPGYASAHVNLGMVLMHAGDMAAAWPELEWRWQLPDFVALRARQTLPRWRGEPAVGRTVLLWAEQGLGDTIHFARYASLAAARGLRAVVQVQAPLVRLLRSLPNVAAVVPVEQAVPADLQCPLLSLPLAFATTAATVPAATAYLRPDPADVTRWQARMPSAHERPLLRVGIAWAGSPRLDVDSRRSIAPALLAPLWDVPGVQWFSLQKDMPAPAGIADPMAAVTDFADTAALVATLDLVVCVDTAIAHLAAAIGRPVWLLDRFDPCWRWVPGHTGTAWYPTMRIYRQPRPGDWPAVLQEVVKDLAHRAPRQPQPTNDNRRRR